MFRPAWQELLSPNGCFFMVAVEDNDPAEIISIMRGYGVRAEVSEPGRPIVLFYFEVVSLARPRATVPSTFHTPLWRFRVTGLTQDL